MSRRPPSSKGYIARLSSKSRRKLNPLIARPSHRQAQHLRQSSLPLQRFRLNSVHINMRIRLPLKPIPLTQTQITKRLPRSRNKLFVWFRSKAIGRCFGSIPCSRKTSLTLSIRQSTLRLPLARLVDKSCRLRGWIFRPCVSNKKPRNGPNEPQSEEHTSEL